MTGEEERIDGEGREKEGEEYAVPEAIFPWFTKKFDKMVKVAGEVGSDPPTYRVVREEFRSREEWNEERGDWVETGVDKVFIVTVEGKPPKLSGWRFVAKLTPTERGNLIKTVPGVTEPVPDHYRTAAPYCDYCKKSRQRLDSFIVRHDETGEYRQVGRNCLSKFLGYSSPERVARMAEWLAGLHDEIAAKGQEYFGRTGRSPEYIDLLSFLTMTAAVIEDRGWVPRSVEREQGKRSTLSEVWFQLREAPHKDRFRHLRIFPTEAHKQKALDAIAFARSDQLQPSSDYEHNLKISTASDAFHHGAAGVVASLLHYVDRARESELVREQRRLEREQQRIELAESSFVGQEGERVSVRVFVVRRRVLEGQFGTSYMFRMLDGDGNLIVWFASTDAMDEERWYKLTGTVKRHEVYEGIRQTIMTRCRVVLADSPGSSPPKGYRKPQQRPVQDPVGVRGLR